MTDERAVIYVAMLAEQEERDWEKKRERTEGLEKKELRRLKGKYPNEQ